jgi:lipopolysaccharide biosynthesis glycosyltransferase
MMLWRQAFALYNYDRIVILDADGLVLKNLDHLFTLPFDAGRRVAGALAWYIARPWLSSVLLVVEPNIHLSQAIADVLSPENITKVSAYSDGSHYDMDILNYVLDSGRHAHLISKYYTILDSYLDNDENFVEYAKTYYVHFTAKKPLHHVEMRRAANTSTPPITPLQTINGLFWHAFTTKCAHMWRKRKLPTLDASGAHRGVAYPDPQAVLSWIGSDKALIDAYHVFQEETQDEEYYIKWS